jgi:hypothetical protein
MSDFNFHPDGLPYNPTDVDVRRQTFTLDTILRMIENGRIEVQRRLEYQRRPTEWSLERRSRLIESLIMRIPLPIFYFDGSSEPWKVIDGVHRLSTFFDFINDKFELRNLQYFGDLTGLKFSKLSFRYQRVIEEATIEAYLINPGTPEDVKYNIFQRINTGGTPLTAQEIRNAFYLKEANDFLNKLVDSDAFIKATEGRITTKGGRAQEVILRCVALYEYFENYQPPMERFLNNAMRTLNPLHTSYKSEIRERFENGFRVCYEIFENKAFRLLNEIGEKQTSLINIALLEAWVVNIARLDRANAQYLVEHRSEVYHLNIQLFKVQEFRNAVTSTTASKKAVAVRHGMILNLIQKVLHVS